MRERLRRSIRAIDQYQRRRTWLAFPIAVVRKMSEDQGGSLAALIAYYGLLSVFPLLLVFAAVLGFVLSGDPALQRQVLQSAERSFPALSGYLDQQVAGNGLALGFGLFGALWAGLGVSMATERAMNTVWNVPLSERPNLWRSRLRGAGMLAVLGLTFLVSTALASLPSPAGALGVPMALASVLGPFGFNAVLYLLAFQVLTNRHLAWRSLIPGAALGAIVWTVLQHLGVLYARYEVAHASRFYGSLAVVIGLLAWIYLGAQLTIYAAEVNVVLSERLWPRGLADERTRADRHALERQALMARRGDESIAVTFADEDSSTPPSAPRSTGGDPDVAAVIEHLRRLERHRLSQETQGEQVARDELRDEADALGSALWRLAGREKALEKALRRGGR